MGVLGGGWTMESGGGQGRGGWIKESVNLVSVGVCRGLKCWPWSWLPKKTGRPGLRRGGVGGYNLHSVPPNSPPDCGTPTTSRLYPFGASYYVLPFHPMFVIYQCYVM